MNKVRVVQLLAVCAAVPVLLLGCSNSPSAPATIVAAPPGPTDLGPASGLSTPPADAIVFDLKYRPQTGAADDIPYRSYWGYGGSEEETKTNSFLQEVRTKASRLHYVNNFSFTGRKWAAVEYQGQQASALYFDLNADGKLGENERIPPTLKTDQGFAFITPDFMHSPEDGSPTLCRVLL
ncbi:MAG TPA: hypothetical protein VNT26_19895, partial [Candidatus Sulfotelmatobacter sp.]|nr:hypothetical protein [Candidatus Sulfotelmatobacter sp.]